MLPQKKIGEEGEVGGKCLRDSLQSSLEEKFKEYQCI